MFLVGILQVYGSMTFRMCTKCSCWEHVKQSVPVLAMFLTCSYLFPGTLAPSVTQPMTCFPFPFPHNLYLILYPTFYLIFLFGHFGYQGQVRSIRFTRRLVSLGLPKEFYLLGSHRPFKPHCVHVGDRPLDLLCRGHLRGIQDLGQG